MLNKLEEEFEKMHFLPYPSKYKLWFLSQKAAVTLLNTAMVFVRFIQIPKRASKMVKRVLASSPAHSIRQDNEGILHIKSQTPNT